MDVKVTRWEKKEKPTMEFLRKMLEDEGLDPYIFTASPGEKYGNHTHSHDEVRIVLEGKFKFGAKDEEIVLNPGDRLDLKKGVEHWASNDWDKTCTLVSANRS